MKKKKVTEKKKKQETLEVLLEELRGIVRNLERGESPLEKSMEEFEKGLVLAKRCQEKLSEAEQKIELLVSSNKEMINTEAFRDDT